MKFKKTIKNFKFIFKNVLIKTRYPNKVKKKTLICCNNEQSKMRKVIKIKHTISIIFLHYLVTFNLHIYITLLSDAQKVTLTFNWWVLYIFVL